MKEASSQIKTRELLKHFPKALGGWTVKAIERFDFFQALRINPAIALIYRAALSTLPCAFDARD